jgi:hypothetical protein
MSIIGMGMAVLPCCAEEDVEAGSAALRVDWPVYPRRAEHNTVAEGGNRRWAEIARQNALRATSRYEIAVNKAERGGKLVNMSRMTSCRKCGGMIAETAS